VELRGRFDGFHEVTASVSKTCLVRFDNNKSCLSGCYPHPLDVGCVHSPE
jgi:hypothetical protein